jgi:hypothetical protein
MQEKFPTKGLAPKPFQGDKEHVGHAKVRTVFIAAIRTIPTALLASKIVLCVEEPVNQTQVMCAKSENKIRKYTIENSPGWKKIHREN